MLLIRLPFRAVDSDDRASRVLAMRRRLLAGRAGTVLPSVSRLSLSSPLSELL